MIDRIPEAILAVVLPTLYGLFVLFVLNVIESRFGIGILHHDENSAPIDSHTHDKPNERKGS